MGAKLYRSRSDMMIGGVCGGLAQYLGVDSTLVRVFFLITALGSSGIGVMVYLLLWIILPVEGQRGEPSLQETVRSGSEEIAGHARSVGEELRSMVRSPNPRTGLAIGGALLLMGIVFLIQNLNLPWLNWLDFDVIWPIILIAGGIALLLRSWRGE
ncbi:MAG: PspC domain-containing protein [Chloroflexi bacterium]|nr:PspC domain-containing protein [Chloroflexota bacterium]